VTRFAFVDAQKAFHDVRMLCRLLGVSRSGYYAWAGRRAEGRAPSARAVADSVLAEQIAGIHAASRGTYGAPRVHAELAEGGVHVGRKRVARLMRGAGLVGVSRRRWRTGCTRRDPAAMPAPDLVDRQFVADRPNELWVADVTYVPTLAGWLYLAVVLDVYSRRVVGWSMSGNRKTALVVDAVTMAVARRGGNVAGVIHHSGHGAEYSSHDLERALRAARITASMGSVGDCYDNGLAESFFATLETELFVHEHGGRFHTHHQARLAIFDWIEAFYNRRRRHCALGHLSPEAFEQQHLTAAA
jgi:putative transposase